MSSSAPDIVNRYFAALNSRDGESLLGLFTPDAVVVDEGQTWRGASEIRTWVDDVVFRFEYTAGVLGVESAGDGEYVARAPRGELSGRDSGAQRPLRSRGRSDQSS